jgi:omega-amidase
LTTSNIKWKTYAIQMATSDNFDTNIAHLLELIAGLPKHSIIVTPEVCLTGFAYDRMDEAAQASLYAVEQVKKMSEDKIITLTTIEKEGDNFVNRTDVIYNGEIVHSQHKVKLFPLGNEHLYFKAGSEDEIKIFEIDGIKFGIIVCFELRFPEYWLKLRGADIILNPSLWGKPRKQHYEILTRAVAIANQCYVVAADSANPDMARSSAVIDPNGKAIMDDYAEVIEGTFDPREVQRIRRYINMDIFHG